MICKNWNEKQSTNKRTLQNLQTKLGDSNNVTGLKIQKFAKSTFVVVRNAAENENNTGPWKLSMSN